MGGRALKNIETRRCSRSEFDEISQELTTIIKKRFNKVGIPMFYNNKESFGDIDIIVSEDMINGDIRDYIIKTFQPNEIFHNGSCWSFDYKTIQIDIVTTAPEHFDSTLFYMNYNDLNNLVGRLAQTFGLKFGQQGLWYEHHFKGTNIGSIPISKDFEKVYSFLGLSWETYLNGFDELEDIFKFVASSKYFDGERYQLDKLNKINRDRNLKRKSYMSFLEWIKDNPVNHNNGDIFNLSREEYNLMIETAFSEARLEMGIRKLEYEHCKTLYIKAKFNGGDIMHKYNLTGKDLGVAIRGFQKAIEEINVDFSYDDYILNHTIDHIYEDFETYMGIN